MATMPGIDADVFWGDPSKPPPDWRDHPIPDTDDESDDPTPERRKWVVGALGFDPRELGDDGDETADTDTDESAKPLHESAPSTAAGRLAQKAAELWESGENYP